MNVILYFSFHTFKTSLFLHILSLLTGTNRRKHQYPMWSVLLTYFLPPRKNWRRSNWVFLASSNKLQPFLVSLSYKTANKQQAKNTVNKKKNAGISVCDLETKTGCSRNMSAKKYIFVYISLWFIVLYFSNLVFHIW